MSIAFTEKQIQDHIWTVRKSWPDLLVEAELPASHVKSEADLNALSASELMHDAMIRRLERLQHTIRSMELFGVEVPLEKVGDSDLLPKK